MGVFVGTSSCKLDWLNWAQKNYVQVHLISWEPFEGTYLGTRHVNHISISQDIINNLFIIEYNKTKASGAFSDMISYDLMLNHFSVLREETLELI